MENGFYFGLNAGETDMQPIFINRVSSPKKKFDRVNSNNYKKLHGITMRRKPFKKPEFINWLSLGVPGKGKNFRLTPENIKKLFPDLGDENIIIIDPELEYEDYQNKHLENIRNIDSSLAERIEQNNINPLKICIPGTGISFKSNTHRE